MKRLTVFRLRQPVLHSFSDGGGYGGQVSFQFPLDLSAVALAKEDPGISLSPLTSREPLQRPSAR